MVISWNINKNKVEIILLSSLSASEKEETSFSLWKEWLASKKRKCFVKRKYLLPNYELRTKRKKLLKDDYSYAEFLEEWS